MISKTAEIGIISIVCYLFIFSSCAYAIGIGANPAKLEVEIENGVGVQKIITISNPDDIELGFHIYTDDEFTNWITISDPVFSLEPYQKKEVTIHFAPDTDKVGTFNSTIYAVATNPDSSFNLGSGVKIPAYITIKTIKKAKTSFYTNPAIIALIFFGFVTILIYMSRLRKS